MKIRNATSKDKATIAALHRSSITGVCRSHYEPDQLAAWTKIIQPDIYDQALNEKLLVVAEIGPDLVGFGILDGEKGEVSAVYIAPEFTGQGVGGAILRFLEHEAALNDHRTLTVYATLNAEGFYSARGYQLVTPASHTLPDGTCLPCLEMTKMLPSRNPVD